MSRKIIFFERTDRIVAIGKIARCQAHSNSQKMLDRRCDRVTRNGQTWPEAEYYE